MDSSAGAFSFPSSRLFSSSILLNAKKGKSSLEGLIVRTLAGQVAEVLVDLSGSVLELQKRIFKHLGVPVEGQVIFFKGKKLSSSAKESLKKLGVVAGDSIVLTFSYAQYRQLKSKKTLDISSSQRSINNRRIKFLNVDSMGKGNKSSLTRNVDLDEFIRLLSTRDRESSRSRDLSDNLSDLLRRDTEESFLDPESKVSEAEHGQLEGSEDNKSSSSESTDNEEIESSAENEANELDQDSGFVNERMAGVPRANLNQRNFQLHQSKLDELVAMGFSENGAKRALAINNNFTEGALNWLLEHSDDNSIHRPVSEEELRSLAARNSSLASLLLRGGLAIPEGGEGIEMHVDEEDGQIHLGNMEEEVAPSEFGRHDPLLIHALSNSESEEDEEEEDDEFEDPESEFPDVQLYGNEDSGGDMDTGDDEKDHDDEGEVWGL